MAGIKVGPLSRRGIAAISIGAAMILAAGCQGSVKNGAGDPSSPTGSATTSATPSTDAATLAISPATTTAKVAPDTAVTVRASGGAIGSVSLKDSAGHSISGTLSADGTTWTASQYLKPGTSYTASAKAAQGSGTATSTFATATAKVTATYHLLPTAKTTVGVGMPIIVTFDSPVSTQGQQETEKHLVVKTTPSVTGSWGWMSSTVAMWRPASYWKTGTKVSLKANLTGVKTGSGKYVGTNSSTSFTIGAAMVSTVNMSTHRMTVTRNGKVIKTLLVSTGRPGPETETRNGIKIIMTKEPQHVMDSASIGIPKGSPGYYHIVAMWAMRLTYSGEFLHSAPWSVGAQGNSNVSHGCTNLSPSGAVWLFNESNIGDVVKYIGGHRALEPGNGWTLWNYTFAQWQKKSALA